MAKRKRHTRKLKDGTLYTIILCIILLSAMVMVYFFGYYKGYTDKSQLAMIEQCMKVCDTIKRMEIL